MSILQLLSADGFIAVNRRIAEVAGLEAAVVLGELASESLYWEEHEGLEDGFFYSTVENLGSRVYLSAHGQRQALDKLQELGLVDVEKKGMPARRYIRIHDEKVLQVVNDKSLKFLTTSGENIARQVVKNFNTNNNITNNKQKEENSNKHIKGPSVYDCILNEVEQIRNDPQLQQTFADFIEMRKKIKAPLTERALKMVVNETVKLSNGDPDLMRQILNQSILHDWKGVYPLKNAAYQAQAPAPSNNPFTDMLAREGYTGEDII